jgi:hypothetical protein
MTIRAFSFGGGQQSVAALVLASQGAIDFPLFVFANVGNDSEHPATLAYLEDHAKPFARKHGIELVEVQKTLRSGEKDTLLKTIERRKQSVVIPVRINGGSRVIRTCTVDFKVKQVAKLLKQRGATQQDPAVVGIGFSVDEMQRMRTKLTVPWETPEYPLIDLRIDREGCQEVVRSAGLPVPPKSSCWFCPFHAIGVFKEMHAAEPEMFWRVASLERTLSERMQRIGTGTVTFNDKKRSLPETVLADHDLSVSLFDEGESCDIGHCMT